METNEIINQLREQVKELESQLVAVKESGGTGQSPCANFCESVALSKDFKRLEREKAELVAHIESLELLINDAKDADPSMHIMGKAWFKICDKLMNLRIKKKKTAIDSRKILISGNCVYDSPCGIRIDGYLCFTNAELNQIKAEAGRAGYQAAINDWGNNPDNWLDDENNPDTSCDQYAASIAKGE